MRKALKSRAQFVFLDAPFAAASTLAPSQLAELGGDAAGGGLSWFCWSDLGPDKRPSLAVKYSRWDETYAALCAALREQRPDGLLGFSQGATAAALFLAALRTAQRDGRDLDVPLPKFCIAVAGFLPRDPDYAKLLEDAATDVPTLFVMGTADRLIPPARSHALMDTFDQACADLYEHPGAHMVPTCTGEFKARLCDFLDRFRQGGGAAAASASVGSSLSSLSLDEDRAAAVGRP
ncbi:dfr1 [Scenedesmus sp. PABB004]|nr:dfr1 [Scenedesmus sp. PABB004]